MPYVDKCPSCHGNGHKWGWKEGKLGPCDTCGGTGVFKHRRQLDQFDATRLYGWTRIHSWPKYGPTGHCQICGKPLTGRKRTRCGDRICDALIWRRLYEGVHWTKRHLIVRDGPACRICGTVYESPLVEGGPVYPEPHRLTVDHIIPLADGGTEREDNLQLVCPSPCHAEKTATENRRRMKLDRDAGPTLFEEVTP